MARKTLSTKGGNSPVQRKITNAKRNAKVKKSARQTSVTVSPKKKSRSFNNYGS